MVRNLKSAESGQGKGSDANAGPSGRHPLDGATEDAVSEVELALVAAELAVAEVERLVVDEQADDLAVGDAHQRLTRFRIAVGGLCVRQRA